MLGFVSGPRDGIAAVVCAVALVCAGCSADPEPSGPPAPGQTYPNWPATLDSFRFRWTAEPGIDLLTGAAVPIRAYLEGRRVAEFTAGTGSSLPTQFESYPGFGSTVKRPTGLPWKGPDPVEVWDAYPDARIDIAGKQLFGNEYFHLLQLDPIDGGYRAYVCDGRYNLFVKKAKGNAYETTEGVGFGKFDYIFVWRVEVRNHRELPERGPQRGPNPAPADDVFDGAQILAGNKARWGGFEGVPNTGADPSESRTSAENHRRCLDKMPDSPHDMGIIAASRPTEPPAFEPAVPGWPAQAG